MGRLTDFKTKCIRRFVEYMKKWLNNWELKQEFLVNLRKEFIVQNVNMHQALSTMEEIEGDANIKIS